MAIRWVSAKSLYLGKMPRRPKTKRNRAVKKYWRKWSSWSSPENLSDLGRIYFASIDRGDIEVISIFHPECDWIVNDPSSRSS